MGSNADKLSYLIETKKVIKKALIDKGVDVSENDTFRSYVEKIENIPSGGGDVVYATNRTPSTPTGKVLIKKGTSLTEDYNETITGASKARTFPALFWDDNTFLIGYDTNYIRLQYIDNSWVSSGISWTSIFNTIGVIQNLANDVNIFHDCFSTSQSYGVILTENGYEIGSTPSTTAEDWGQYLGEYNGIHYCMSSSQSNNDVYVFDYDNKVRTTTLVINSTNTFKGGFLEGNRILLYGHNTNSADRVRIYELTEDGLSSTTIADTTSIEGKNFVALTGLNEGDIIFATNNHAGWTTAIAPTSPLFLYEIQKIEDSYTIVETSIETLDWLKTTPCLFSYDRRNKVLIVGTNLGVRAYQFNDNKTFTEISLNLTLPVIEEGFCYRPYMSPSKRTVMVSTVGATTDTWTIHQLADEDYSIIDNRTLNYQPETVFTGVVTGKVQDGKYEVKTILG